MNSGREDQRVFNEAEVRAAEHALEQALQSPDPTAWVYSYTEDAVFVAPGAPAVEGRAALPQMARAVTPAVPANGRHRTARMLASNAAKAGN